MMFELSPFDRRNNNLFHYFDDLSRDLFRNDDESVSPCRTDIVDKGDYFELRADMPGFKKEEIHIDVDGDRLTISAQHKEETEEEKGRYVRRERRRGLVLTCKEHMIGFYAALGFADEGISGSAHGGAVWHQMRLTL